MSQYLYLRCPVCDRVAPLVERRGNDGTTELMRFEWLGASVDVPFACRRCVMTPGWHIKETEGES